MRDPLPMRLLLVLFMMAPVLAINGLLLHILAQQSLAASLPQATGLITHSEVVSSSSDEGNSDTYSFEVRYTYKARGLELESSRYRYAAWGSSNRSRVEDFARRFPVGARVPVFYDPESPWNAVLVTGMDALPLYLLMCMLPLTVAALLGSWRMLRPERRPGEPTPEGLVHAQSTDELSPLVVGIIAVGGASFVMGFVLASNPSLSAQVVAWG